MQDFTRNDQIFTAPFIIIIIFFFFVVVFA